MLPPVAEFINLFGINYAVICIMPSVLKRVKPLAVYTKPKKFYLIDTCGLYCKHITIANDDSSVIKKFEASLAEDARVIIYHMFIVQATGGRNWQLIFTD